jgi:hypothetical protein
MRPAALCAAALVILSVVALADDQEKAEKQIRMMTAMSRDDTARSIVSRTFADAFKVERPQLVVERKSLGLNYGGLFLAHELLLSGARMDQIVDQLRSRKSILDVSAASHADWKRIAADAKKMNSRINDAIYKHFLHSKPDELRDKLERYNPSADLVKADAAATPDEIAKAQHEYVFWRDQAAPIADNPADRSSPTAQTYEQNREDIAITHGDMPNGPR